jgi:tetratricopeptide (TPR) repeat protein
MIRFSKSILAMLATGLIAGVARAAVEPRLVPIQAKELPARAPLASAETHLTAITRAASCSLSQDAYRAYSRLAEKNPKSAEAQLYRAVTAERYWIEAGAHAATKQPRALNRKQLEQIRGDARASFSRSLRLSPKLEPALREAGSFAWQHDNRRAEGVFLLRRALALNPRDPLLLVQLAELHLNPTAGSYNPKMGQIEAKRAAALDPHLLHPHWLLAGFYLRQNQLAAAQAEVRKGSALLPPGREVPHWIRALESRTASR